MDVDTIYIHPKPLKYKTVILGEHFSFAPKKMAETVKSGFRAAIETLRKYEFKTVKKSRKSRSSVSHSFLFSEKVGMMLRNEGESEAKVRFPEFP